MTRLARKKIPYNPSHVYEIEFVGEGKRLEIYIRDAQFSSMDNNGAITVDIYR